jgi:hypothetical protein
MHPHIYKTNDGGKSWKEIVNGLPNDPINVVREDPLRKGLLYAGSERAVYVSFDDGENWQSLRLNMPATSIRDLVIKDDDLVIGTHGRSFWILDNITPLRQLTNQIANSNPKLYKPQDAYRVRWNMYPDTPVPQEEPAGENPPDGAVIDYFLTDKAKDVTLEIWPYNKGKEIVIPVRKYSNSDTLYKIADVNIPHYWIRPQQILSAEPGHHRFMWDMKYAHLNVPPSYPISATYMNTEPDQTSPWVMPGNYKVRLTVDGKSFDQTIFIKMDPRVKTSVNDLQTQHDLSIQCYNKREECLKILDEINNAGEQAKSLAVTPQGSNEPSFSRLSNAFASIFNTLQECDSPPTMQAMDALKEAQKQFDELLIKWKALKGK